MAKYRIKMNGDVYEMEVELIGDGIQSFNERKLQASAPQAAHVQAPESVLSSVNTNDSTSSDGSVRSLMPGTILNIFVNNGDKVSKGDVLLILEAMKMENEVKAPADGTVSELNISVGQSVSNGEMLCKIV